eukprot:GHVS01099233.1.p1 GENE.GHVS01099233.1~~GHVS01099233.1.p1  ORF type:complete len:426 (-),score=109.21 GHVS01099233.1:284-1561(-)
MSGVCVKNRIALCEDLGYAVVEEKATGGRGGGGRMDVVRDDSLMVEDEQDEIDWAMTEKSRQRMLKEMQKAEQGEEEQEEEERRRKRKRKLEAGQEEEGGGGEEEMVTAELGDEEMNKLLEELQEGGRLSVDAIISRSRGVVPEVKAKEVEGEDEPEDEETRRVSQLYVHLGDFLKRYRSGRVPKALKMLPRLRNWEQLLYKTTPTEWSPQAMCAATRIFASSFNPRMAQRFYNLVLLPNVREDIAENRKLNYHLYQAMTKAVFKPAAWFKGILLPLVMEGCSLREVVIVGSVLSRMSIPVLHSAAALMRLSDITSADSALAYIVNLLLAKKYSLPLKVIGRLVEYFGQLAKNEDTMFGVIWHKCLLTLVQKYKCDLTVDQRETVLLFVRLHSHHLISPEIRRELSAGPAAKRRRVGDVVMAEGN